jgi:hypothetical protein
LREGLVESAARGFTSSERATALFAAAGVEACPTLPESRRRFIFRQGRPRRWPLSPAETIGAAARVAFAWTRRDHRPHAGESVAAWGHRVIGPAATRWLIAPALQGIYATPPDVLSAAAIFGPSRGPGGASSRRAAAWASSSIDCTQSCARGVTFVRHAGRAARRLGAHGDLHQRARRRALIAPLRHAFSGDRPYPHGLARRHHRVFRAAR